MARICPSCSNPMKLETIHGVGLSVCTACRGIWFEADELRSLLAQDPQAFSDLEHLSGENVAQASQGPSTLVCPDDMTPLEHYHYMYNSTVVLQTCPTCGGFFVAADELTEMETWRAKANRPPDARESVAVTIAEATVEHDQEMHRLHNLSDFFGVLSRYRTGWYGFFP